MKKYLAIIMAAVLAVTCFVGCGKTETADNEIVIGGIGPITGPAAAYGNAVMNGAQLAVDEINAAGGIGFEGIKIKFDFQDDEHDAEKAVNAYNTLLDNNMKILMGTVTSTPCVAVAAKAAEDNMFLLTPSGSAVECVAAPNAFRICFSDPDQGIASAQYIAQHNVAKKVAVIYNSSDVYSDGIYQKFAAEAKVQGLEIVTAQAFTKDSATDFTVQIQKVKESGAELMFLPIYYQEAALILTQANKAGLDIKVFGCDGLDGVIDQLGDNAAIAEGVMLLTPFAADAEDELTKSFTAAYQKKYNEIPTQFAADGYDAIYTIKMAMERVGIEDASISASDLCEALKSAMVEIEVEGVTGTMSWAASGEPVKEPKAMVIKDGSYKAM